MRAPAPILLEAVLEYLNCRGLRFGDDATVTALTDGVSARVYLAETATARWVVKQALPELNVKTEWLADPHRATTEAAALKLVHQLTPNNVPVVIDADPVDCVITMTAAPRGMENWRTKLLGTTPPARELNSVGGELGRLLSSWHRATWGDQAVAARFADDKMFENLRLAPFHRAVLERYPELASALGVCIEELSTKRECLVHGDFSPKNILVSPLGVWVLDFEVARVGAAVFDLAFLGHHLAMKAIVVPHRAHDLQRSFDHFLTAYRHGLGRPVDDQTLGWHIAALMLARVDGVSPAGYLSEEQRVMVRAAARSSLGSADSSSTYLWSEVRAQSRMVTK